MISSNIPTTIFSILNFVQRLRKTPLAVIFHLPEMSFCIAELVGLTMPASKIYTLVDFFDIYYQYGVHILGSCRRGNFVFKQTNLAAAQRIYIPNSPYHYCALAADRLRNFNLGICTNN
jgi:hypothetical protein